MAAAFLVENLQYGADPCTDFYEFVCGNFQKKHTLPDGASQLQTLDSMTSVKIVLIVFWRIR